MTKLWRYVFVPALLFASLTSSAQNQVRARDEVKASPVQLLPGYRIQIVRGIESVGGTISKDPGTRIEFTIGGYFGVAADLVDRKDVAWREEQVINGQRVICVYTKSNDFVISIPKLITNFRSHIRTKQDLGEMLLMVLTFEPSHGYPVEPGAVVVTPPGNQ
jgi:hypothetical protein